MVIGSLCILSIILTTTYKESTTTTLIYRQDQNWWRYNHDTIKSDKAGWEPKSDSKAYLSNSEGGTDYLLNPQQKTGPRALATA